MSPHHKRIIPAMAEHYGFDFEFVTYKWPHWLHKQTDKQRIIWAYKILFLDVLFPLDVPRMIFVDSDQVIRTDLAELYNMDLKVGSPEAWRRRDMGSKAVAIVLSCVACWLSEQHFIASPRLVFQQCAVTPSLLHL